jgi:hypothetical protein
MNPMRTFILGIILAASMSFGQHSALERQTLTNEGVVDLAKAGFSEAFILDLVQFKRTRFDTSVDGLTFLAKKGLSERVIRAIVANSDKPEAGGTIPPQTPAGMQILPYYSYNSGYLPSPTTAQPERWYSTFGRLNPMKAESSKKQK